MSLFRLLCVLSLVVLPGLLHCGGGGESEGASELAADAAPSEPSTEPVIVPEAKPEPTKTGSPGCGKSVIEAGASKQTFSFGGKDTEYSIFVPESYDASQPTALVLNFHGGGSNAAQQQFFSQLDQLAKTENFIVVYPNGADKFWNVGFCCGSMERDDVAYTKALLKELQEKLCVDNKRVYATGMSNGGHLAFRLGCEAADLFAAIAPVAGLTFDDNCTPSRPIPVLHFHGTQDGSVPYEGGKEYKTQDKTYTSPKIKDVFASWAKRNGCTDTPKTSLRKGVATCETYTQCKEGAEVTLCTSQDVGHCWPGNSFCASGKSTTDISANELMWAFFQKHPLP